MRERLKLKTRRFSVAIKKIFKQRDYATPARKLKRPRSFHSLYSLAFFATVALVDRHKSSDDWRCWKLSQKRWRNASHLHTIQLSSVTISDDSAEWLRIKNGLSIININSHALKRNTETKAWIPLKWPSQDCWTSSRHDRRNLPVLQLKEAMLQIKVVFASLLSSCITRLSDRANDANGQYRYSRESCSSSPSLNTASR